MVLNWEKVETYSSVAILTAAAAGFAGGLFFETRPYHRIALSSAAIALSGAGIILVNCKGKQAQWEGKLALNSMREAKATIEEGYLEQIHKIAHPRAAREPMTAELVEERPALPAAENPYYNWDNLPDDLTCAIVAGNTGYGKSSVVLWLLGKLTEREPAIIKVLDPHAVKNNWHNHGLTVISDFGEIEREFIEAEKELDRRRMQPGDYPPIILVLDELGACMDNFQDPKKVAKINRRIASEGRKFDITGVIANQSDNCSAIGLDSKYKANYTHIFVGELARRQFKKGSLEYELLKSTAYPCAVAGNIPETSAKHPTHGDYSQFKKKGNAPQNLLPINQITENDRPAIDLEKTEPVPIDVALEKIYSADNDIPAKALSQAEWELYGLAVSTGSLSVRHAQRSAVARREHWDSDRVKQIFSRFSELGLGSIQHGARDSVEFKVDGDSDD